jgi:acyl-CoA oxidase
MRKFKSFVFHLSNEPLEVFRLRMELVSLVDPSFFTRLGVHYGLAIGTLRGQATAEQFQFWVQKGALGLNKFVGCFAMTELGHGSNVAGLETTAVFDHNADQFIINTPSITATKWWIGGAAHSATHAFVFARLIVDGQDYGVKPFVVPLRHVNDYTLRPGISIGDIGMKMGRNGIDNGWIQFTNVRIPRTYMLMKYTKVSRDGEVTQPPINQLAYGALIQGRVSMVMDSANVAKKALTIAIRYGAVRRQFASNTSSNDDSASGDDSEQQTQQGAPIETQLLDYTIHQYRLMPLLAQAFAMHFTGQEMNRIYDDLMNKLENLNANSSKKAELVAVIDYLKESHATSAGLKAFGTWNCLNTIEQCRQALGGHGYSSYNGLAQMYNDFAVQCSWEGDNTILTLQAGRYLINCYVEVSQKKKKMPVGVYYLNNMEKFSKMKSKVSKSSDFTLDEIYTAFGVVRASVVAKLGQDYEKLIGSMSKEQALEEVAIKRLFAAKMHTVGYLFDRFKDGIEKCKSADIKSVLVDLCSLYGLYMINENGCKFFNLSSFLICFSRVHAIWLL